MELGRDQKIRLLCVDDSADIAGAIARAAKYEAGIELVGVLNECGGLTDAVTRLRPDVVLLDLSMPGEAPLTIIPQLIAASPHLCVVVFSGYDDGDTKDRCRAAGAAGFVSKHADFPAIFGAVRAAASARAVERAPTGGPNAAPE